MSVQIAIITHDEIGQALLSAVKTTFGELPLRTLVIRVNRQDDPNQIVDRAKTMLQPLSLKDGLLILTDVFGSTPSNIAQALHCNNKTRMVSGLNLPMLIRIMNYPTLDVDSLAQKAVSGGREGIIECLHDVT